MSSLDEVLAEFNEKIREVADGNIVSIKLVIDCEGFTADINFKHPEQLKKRGISMRNLRGDFIK